ncbi:unnamed protein product [Spirodela intermedia]|uniref:Uncharacterized protein n=1 Tax=Spirodela intermedia TaxID=51605 RepID=A0A7I8JKG1_SPIIN|nr:unnamed protein product [Spirodela intermedia]CAA6670644.1 unnamed protein product [Spirodela intermedia]
MNIFTFFYFNNSYLLTKMSILVSFTWLRAPRASAQNHSPLTIRYLRAWWRASLKDSSFILDHQSLMKKDDAVCSRLKLGGDDS